MSAPNGFGRRSSGFRMLCLRGSLPVRDALEESLRGDRFREGGLNWLSRWSVCVLGWRISTPDCGVSYNCAS